MKKSSKQSEQLPDNVISGRPVNSQRKLIIAVMLVCTVIFILLFTTIARYLVESRYAVCKPGNQIFKQAADSIDKQNFESLNMVVAKIEKDKTYRSSGDCLYPVLEQTMNQKEISKTKQYLLDFKQATNGVKELDSSYRINGISTPKDVVEVTEAFLSEQQTFDVNRTYFR